MRAVCVFLCVGCLCVFPPCVCVHTCVHVCVPPSCRPRLAVVRSGGWSGFNCPPIWPCPPPLNRSIYYPSHPSASPAAVCLHRTAVLTFTPQRSIWSIIRAITEHGLGKYIAAGLDGRVCVFVCISLYVFELICISQCVYVVYTFFFMDIWYFSDSAKQYPLTELSNISFTDTSLHSDLIPHSTPSSWKCLWSSRLCSLPKHWRLYTLIHITHNQPGHFNLYV